MGDAAEKLTRDQQRNRRRREVRARTQSTKRLPKSELEIGRRLYPETGYWRPETRGDCEAIERPCPYTSCRHHLFLDVHPRSGAIVFNFPDLEPDQLIESCSLDVAEAEGETLEVVGELLNITRERVRQLEVRALAKLLKHRESFELDPDEQLIPVRALTRNLATPPAEPKRRGRPVRFTDDELATAMNDSQTLAQAATRLGISYQQLNSYTERNAEMRALWNAKKRRRGDPARFGVNPGVVDMAGQTCGTWFVVERAANVSGNARWRCKHVCGAVHVLEGIRLRSKPPQFCETCRPKRPGTVMRRRPSKPLESAAARWRTTR